ncbi:MAG: hypothetical protein QNJ72_09030 [Pleurocapsa sp. MO_226.B13]|nr:hypothetical protein [Pleurocapsa sp. MO_226.B13]
MSNIQLYDLASPGSELFNDSESFLDELSEDQTSSLVGGGITGVNINFGNISIFSNSAITANSNSINANTIGNANTGIDF